MLDFEKMNPTLYISFDWFLLVKLYLSNSQPRSSQPRVEAVCSRIRQTVLFSKSEQPPGTLCFQWTRIARKDKMRNCIGVDISKRTFDVVNSLILSPRAQSMEIIIKLCSSSHVFRFIERKSLKAVSVLMGWFRSLFFFQGLSRSRLAHHKSALKYFFGLMVKLGKLAYNPAETLWP